MFFAWSLCLTDIYSKDCCLRLYLINMYHSVLSLNNLEFDQMYQFTRIKLPFPFASSPFLIIIFFCIMCLCWVEMVGKDNSSPPATTSIISATAVTLPLLFLGRSWHWHLDLWPAAWGGRADGQLEDRHAQLQLQFHHYHQHRFQPGED